LRRGVNFQGYSQRQIVRMLQIAKIAKYDYLKLRVKINYTCGRNRQVKMLESGFFENQVCGASLHSNTQIQR
jgi:hypothetical protein